MELALFPLRFVLLTKSQETEADFEAQKRNASNRRKIVDIMTYIIYKPKSHLELQSLNIVEKCISYNGNSKTTTGKNQSSWYFWN